MRQYSKRAFTLVELLVVVGVIAILIALLMPVLNAVRSQAKAVRCISNIRQLGLGLKLYAADNKDYFPINVSTPVAKYWNDADRVGHYLASPTSAMNGSSVYWCPADDDGQQSYAMNIWASSAVDKSVLSSALYNGQLWSHRRVSGSMILLAESWSYLSNGGSGFVPPQVIGKNKQSAGQRFGAAGGIPPYSAGRWGTVNCELVYARHRPTRVPGAFTQAKGRISILFDDGHAALCSDTDLIDESTQLSSGLAAWSALDYVRD